MAGTLGGSPLQVSGPAAGLTVIVAGLIEQFGWPATCAITAAAGLLQALLGFARVGRVALAIAPVVVHAMLAGIGIIIVLQQTHVLLGAEAGESAWQNVIALPASFAPLDPQAAVLGLAVILLLLGWKYMPASLRRVPGTPGGGGRRHGAVTAVGVRRRPDHLRRVPAGRAVPAATAGRTAGAPLSSAS